MSFGGSQTSKELKAIREQTATFSRDIGHLRKELAVLKSKSEEDLASVAKSRGHEDVALLVEAKVVELLDRQAEEKDLLRDRVAALEQESRGSRDESEAIRRLVHDVEVGAASRADELRTLLDQEFQDRLAACRQLEELFAGLGRAPPRARQLEVVPEEAAMPDSSAVGEADHDGVLERLLQLEDAVSALSTDRDGGAQAALLRLEKMQGSVADCQTWLAQHAFFEKAFETLQGSVGELSAKLGETSERSTRELQELSATVEHLRGRVLDCESLCDSAMDFKETLENAATANAAQNAEELAASAARLATLREQVGCIQKTMEQPSSRSRLGEDPEATAAALAERLDGLERVVGDRVDKNVQGMSALRAKVDLIDDRLTACELRGSSSSTDEGKAAPGSFAEEQHVTELSALRAAHAKLVGEVHARHAELRDVAAQEMRAEADRRSALEMRLESLEDSLRESIHDCEKGMTLIRSDHAKLMGEAKARDIRYVGLEERLAGLVDAVESSTEERARADSATNALLDQFQRRLADEMSARGQHHCFVRDLISKEKEERAVDRAVLVERLERIELEAECQRRLAGELKALQAAQCKAGEEAKALESHRAATLERFDELERVCQSLEERISAGVAENSGDGRRSQVLELRQEALGQDHGHHSEQIKALDKAHTERHISLSERVCVLEKAFENSVSANTQGIRDAQARLEKMQTKWAKVREAWHRDLEPVEASLSDGLSLSQHGWETNSQCGSWVSEDPLAALNLASATTRAGESSCD